MIVAEVTNIYDYYPTVLVIVQKRVKQVQISPDIAIVQLVIVKYRARAHPVTLVVFFQVTEKG